MGTSTLHLNNPVPSNGAVAASLGGRHTVTVTLAGVGAISCKVQAWASSNNTDSKMLGAPVVISGTTTVSQTLIFDAGDCNQFWLALVEISPACTFNATVENSGDVAVAGAVLGLSRSPGLVYDMPNLRKGLADAISGAGDCVIGVIGDSHNASLGVGSGGTSLYNGANPFSPSTIASKIVGGRAGLRIVTDSFFGQRGVGASYPLYDTRMTQTGTWTNAGGTNVLGQNGWKSVNAGDTLVYTPEQPWDTVVVYTKRNTGDTGSVRLNVPGSAGDVDINVAGANALIATTLTKTAPDLQPLTITVLVAMSTNAAVLGATFYNSKAKSLRIHNHAASGSQVVNHTVSAAPYSNLPAYNTISANCWMIELLHNDIQLGTTKAVWLAGWATLLATLKTTTRDVIVYIGFPGDRAWATDGTMDDWINSLKPTLDALQINMIDLRTVYGQTYTIASAAGLTYDADHGNKRGAGLYGARMASDILSYQMPSP